MNTNKIISFAVLKDNFFALEAKIDCPVDEYVSSINIDKHFNVYDMESIDLIDIECGIKISKLVGIRQKLASGNHMTGSISTCGVLAVCAGNGSKYIIQLTNLNRDIQVGIEVDCFTIVGFY
eukprot:gnl/Chilomastix_caulleri/7562.p1 GENE.gnl/Chilomastix_caulleri/7562~~gnl/Chilomastix_caulleri/7562.p1  ORF type:complete len:122 (+),score=16.74 gnl/Chilomastix_caulleri/7562:13-378(+)